MDDDVFRLHQEARDARAEVVRLQREQQAAVAHRKRAQQVAQLQYDAQRAAWWYFFQRKLAANPVLAAFLLRVFARVAEKRASDAASN
jgi:hypothetical protein